ncbi:copper ion binding protein [Marininema halotolerans]|uniref:Copper chaperone n=1 Tax=Marininema halotolerans TaxID=1155944 RepID=A0A1I6QAX5_9BACL|nr:copper ion binding protein [Marininema halotolerans]SFS49584.1 copper chaperone [Marininema halotolerans]
MATTVFKVKGMSCDHCKKAVTEALEKIAGVESVTVDLENGVAVVTHQDDTVEYKKMKDAIEEQGYEVEEG